MNRAGNILRRIALLVVALFFIIKCMAQCCEFKLLRNDTTVTKGIFVVEPKTGFQAEVKFVHIPSVVTIVDNVSPLMTYVGVWSNGATTATGFQNNTIAWSNTIGNTVTFSFLGTRLEWFSEYKTSHGRASVVVNGVERIINLGSANTGPGIVAEWNLPRGNYTVIIKVLDAKPVVHDSFRITN